MLPAAILAPVVHGLPGDERQAAVDGGLGDVGLLNAVRPAPYRGPLSCHPEVLRCHLGEDHDFAELRNLVHDDHSLTSGKRERELLTALLEQQRPDLQWQAWTKGLRVYAEPTDRFVERFGVYWEAWRDQPGVGGPLMVGGRLPGPA